MLMALSGPVSSRHRRSLARQRDCRAQTPSGNSAVSCPATSIARRVLPTPPTPVNVTNRCARRTASTSVTSDSRR